MQHALSIPLLAIGRELPYTCGDMTKERVIHTKSSDETEQFGEAFGARLRGGELIELVSDLGGGKTTLTHGIVRGVGSPDRVASPTFTISREYAGGQLHVYHYDLYRLHELGVVGDTLAESLHDERGVTIVEWAGLAEDVLPARRVTITLTPEAERTRRITITAPDELAYLFEENA